MVIAGHVQMFRHHGCACGPRAHAAQTVINTSEPADSVMHRDRSRASTLLAALVSSVIVVILYFGPLASWPWDHDEVHGLVELGVLARDRFPGPVAQVEKMHRLVPAWAVLERSA